MKLTIKCATVDEYMHHNRTLPMLESLCCAPFEPENYRNKTPTVRGLAADNNNMQSVLMGNMETI